MLARRADQVRAFPVETVLAVISAVLRRQLCGADFVAHDNLRPLAGFGARLAELVLALGVVALLLAVLVVIAARHFLQDGTSGIALHNRVSITGRGVGITDDRFAGCAHAHVATAVGLVGNGGTLAVADHGFVVLAKGLSRRADPGQALAGSAIMALRAGFRCGAHAVVRARGLGDVICTKLLAGRALGIHAGSVEAVLAFGVAVLFELDGRAAVVADLGCLVVAKRRTRLANLGETGAVIAVMPGLAGGQGAGHAIVQAGGSGEIIMAPGGVGNTLLVHALALVADLVIVLTINSVNNLLARGIASQQQVVLAVDLAWRADLGVALAVFAVLVGGAGLDQFFGTAFVVAGDQVQGVAVRLASRANIVDAVAVEAVLLGVAVI